MKYIYILCRFKSWIVEIFNRTLLHLIYKAMFINGEGNWVNL